MPAFLSDDILQQLPTPLVRTIRQFDEDYGKKRYFRAVHRLIDMIEVFCKLHTVAGVSQFVHVLLTRTTGGLSSEDIDRMDALRTMLASGLKTPSLGIWWGFARESAEVLSAFDVPHLLEGASRALTYKKSPLKKAFDGNDNLISFRNGYAHGATPSDELCEADIQRILPRLQTLISQSVALSETHLLVGDHEGAAWLAQGDEVKPADVVLEGILANRCYFFNPKQGLCIDLFPLLNYQLSTDPEAEGQKVFFFYNDLRSSAASILNYPFALHVRDKQLKLDFLDVFPIDEWKKLGGVKLDPFRERIESLTEVFKGRITELSVLAEKLQVLRRGFHVVWGPPGVGKSTLLARMTQLLRWGPELRQQSSPGIEWPPLEIEVIEFFIRRGATDSIAQFLDSLNQRLDYRYNLRFPQGSSDSERRSLFYDRLNAVSNLLEEEQRLVLVIDGLDEARRDDGLLDALPRSVPDKIIVIYGSRPQQALRYGFYDELDRERRSCEDLGGLSLEDTRALLYDYVDKYMLEADYAKAVLQQSEGNPLYLKLLCQGLEDGIYKLNDQVLPTNMTELYQNALVQIQKESPEAIDLLNLLAAARDFVSPTMMADLMGMSVGRLQNGPLSACMELLYENELTEDYDDFQLFHESLREHLRANYLQDILGWTEKLAKWGHAWRDADGDVCYRDDSLLYAMKHTALHLLDCRQCAQDNQQAKAAEKWGAAILELVEDDDWRAQCFKVCGNGVHLQYAIKAAQVVVRALDEAGSERIRIFRFARWLYDEPYRLYEAQREQLRQPVSMARQKSHLEDAVQLAKMGQSPVDRLILILTALWAPEQRPATLPSVLVNAVEDWLEEAREPALNKLWALSQGEPS